MTQTPEYVWLTEERTFAKLLRRDGFFSLVEFTQGGIEYEILVGNDEYEFEREDEPGDDDTQD